MKIFKYMTLFIAATAILGCDDTENVLTLPGSQFDYISFENNELSAPENVPGAFTVQFTRSSADLSQQETFNYTLSFPTGLTAAVEGVDYSLPSNSGTIVIPAGVAVLDVELLEILQNTNAVGNRYIQFDLIPVDGYILGSPTFSNAGTLLIVINEDDLFTFGETSFEEVTTFVGDYLYPKTAGVNQANTQLFDPSSTDPFVDWTALASGTEIGFDTSSLASDLIDGGVERMGVFSNANMDDRDANTTPAEFETRFVNGSQGYLCSDMDGTLVVETDMITVPTTASNMVLEISYYMAGTYESIAGVPEEGFEVYWETAAGLGDPLVSELGGAARINQWNNEQIVIPTDRIVDGRIVMRFRNTANDEMTFVDYIAIKGLQ